MVCHGHTDGQLLVHWHYVDGGEAMVLHTIQDSAKLSFDFFRVRKTLANRVQQSYPVKPLRKKLSVPLSQK